MKRNSPYGNCFSLLLNSVLAGMILFYECHLSLNMKFPHFMVYFSPGRFPTSLYACYISQTNESYWRGKPISTTIVTTIDFPLGVGFSSNTFLLEASRSGQHVQLAGYGQGVWAVHDSERTRRVPGWCFHPYTIS